MSLDDIIRLTHVPTKRLRSRHLTSILPDHACKVRDASNGSNAALSTTHFVIASQKMITAFTTIMCATEWHIQHGCSNIYVHSMCTPLTAGMQHSLAWTCPLLSIGISNATVQGVKELVWKQNAVKQFVSGWFPQHLTRIRQQHI